MNFKNFEKYKKLSAALMSGGNTYSMMSNEHPTLEQYFLIKAMHSHFDALGIELWATVFDLSFWEDD